MTHDPALPIAPSPRTDTLWTRAASLLAAFVHAYLPALAFARMKEAPAFLVADALVGVRRIETLHRAGRRRHPARCAGKHAARRR